MSGALVLGPDLALLGERARVREEVAAIVPLKLDVRLEIGQEIFSQIIAWRRTIAEVRHPVDQLIDLIFW